MVKQERVQPLVAGTYEQLIDRESAYEVLRARREHTATAAQQSQAPAPTSTGSGFGDVLGSVFGGGSSGRQSAGEALVNSAARAVGSEAGRQIIRGMLGQGDPDQARLCPSGQCRQAAHAAPVVFGADLCADGAVVETRCDHAGAPAVALGGRAGIQRLLPGE